MGTISGKVIVVTGAARGIGRATAHALHRRGARLALGDIDEVGAATVAREVDGFGAHLDVADPDRFRGFLDEVERAVGPVDVLVNNAGIMPVGPFLDEADAVAERMFAINVLGPIAGTKHVLRSMLARGGGHVVNIASMAGRVAAPGQISYAASKHAVIGFSEGLRYEFADRGIVVTSVLPSFTDTELTSGTTTPRGTRLVSPEEVAEAIARTIVAPRPEVYLPGALGPLVRSQPLIPVPVKRWLGRRFGTDRVFLEVDHGARAAYEDRVRRS